MQWETNSRSQRVVSEVVVKDKWVKYIFYIFWCNLAKRARIEYRNWVIFEGLLIANTFWVGFSQFSLEQYVFSGELSIIHYPRQKPQNFEPALIVFRFNFTSFYFRFKNQKKSKVINFHSWIVCFCCCYSLFILFGYFGLFISFLIHWVRALAPYSSFIKSKTMHEFIGATTTIQLSMAIYIYAAANLRSTEMRDLKRERDY